MPRNALQSYPYTGHMKMVLMKQCTAESFELYLLPASVFISPINAYVESFSTTAWPRAL